MHLAYVTTYDARDMRAWSGAGHHIGHALESQGARVHYIGRLAERRRQLFRLKQVALARIGISRLCDREPSLVRAFAAEIGRRLPPQCDAILTTGTLPIASLETRVPIVFWTDATFAGMVNYYPEFSGLSAASLDQGHAVERAALVRCAMAIYTSEWAAESAIRYYGADPSKVKVVPFGANTALDIGPDRLDSIIADRTSGPCKLLFVGTDWERKGGDLAIRIAAALIHRGVRAELHIVGCIPARSVPPFVRVHGYVSTRDPAGRARFNELFRDARFLVLPSKAECNANVFPEACAFAVPIIATRTGGVTTSVRDGINGRAFAPSAAPGLYADYIESLLDDPAAYRDLAMGAYEQYRTRLNWSVAAATVLKLLGECVSRYNSNALRAARVEASSDTGTSECVA